MLDFTKHWQRALLIATLPLCAASSALPDWHGNKFLKVSAGQNYNFENEAPGVVQLGNYLVVFGGLFTVGQTQEFRNRLYLFDFQTVVWTELTTTGLSPRPRYKHLVAALPDGKIFSFGGFGRKMNESTRAVDDVLLSDSDMLYMLDFQDQRWSIPELGSDVMTGRSPAAFGAIPTSCSPSGIMLGVGRSTLLITYKLEGNDCLGEAFQVTVGSDKAWHDLIAVDQCTCDQNSRATGARGCFAWITRSNSAVVGEDLFLQHNNSLYSYRHSDQSWSLIKAGLGCCDDHQAVKFRGAASAGELYIFTSNVENATSIWRYNLQGDLLSSLACQPAKWSRAESLGAACDLAMSSRLPEIMWHIGGNEELLAIHMQFDSLPCDSDIPVPIMGREAGGLSLFMLYPYVFSPNMDKYAMVNYYGSFSGLYYKNEEAPQHDGDETLGMTSFQTAQNDLNHGMAVVDGDIYVFGCGEEGEAGVPANHFMTMDSDAVTVALPSLPDDSVCSPKNLICFRQAESTGKEYSLTCNSTFAEMAGWGWTTPPVVTAGENEVLVYWEHLASTGSEYKVAYSVTFYTPLTFYVVRKLAVYTISTGQWSVHTVTGSGTAARPQGQGHRQVFARGTLFGYGGYYPGEGGGRDGPADELLVYDITSGAVTVLQTAKEPAPDVSRGFHGLVAQEVNGMVFLFLSMGYSGGYASMLTEDLWMLRVPSDGSPTWIEIRTDNTPSARWRHHLLLVEDTPQQSTPRYGAYGHLMLLGGVDEADSDYHLLDIEPYITGASADTSTWITQPVTAQHSTGNGRADQWYMANASMVAYYPSSSEGTAAKKGVVIVALTNSHQLYTLETARMRVLEPLDGGLIGMTLSISLQNDLLQLMNGTFGLLRGISLTNTAAQKMTIEGFPGSTTMKEVAVPVTILRCDGFEGVALKLEGTPSFSLINVTIRDCHNSDEDGAALYLSSIVSDCPLLQTVTVINTTAPNGPALYAEHIKCLINASNVHVLESHAVYSGGAMYLYNANLNVSLGSLTQCSANKGGAVYLVDSYLDLSDVSISNNQAIIMVMSGRRVLPEGGGIAMYLSWLNAKGCVMTDNIAMYGYGGGLYSSDSSFDAPNGERAVTLTAISLFNNRALYGGGFFSMVSFIYLVECQLSSNLADKEGAAGFLAESYLIESGSSVVYNQATNGGGFALQRHREATLAGTLFHANVAATLTKRSSVYGDGGALYIESGYDTDAIVNVTGGQLLSNSAQRGGGLAQRCDPDCVLIAFFETAVADCTAVAGGGGGLYYDRASSPPYIVCNNAVMPMGTYCSSWTGNQATGGGYGPDAATPAISLVLLQPDINASSGGALLDLLVLANDAFGMVVSTGDTSNVVVELSPVASNSCKDACLPHCKDQSGVCLSGSDRVTLKSGWWRVEGLILYALPGRYTLQATSFGLTTALFNVTVRNCTAGEFLSDDTTCQACQAGTYIAPWAGDSQSDATAWCPPCPAGTYGRDPPGQLCTPCPAGTYQNLLQAASREDCLECAMNYISMAGASQCIPCGANAESTTESTCICSPGYIDLNAPPPAAPSPINGSSAASVGTLRARRLMQEEVSSWNASHQAPTNAPTTAFVGGLPECSECPRGYFSFGGSTAVCTACNAGTFSSAAAAPSSDSCITCPAGHFSLEGAYACAECPNGAQEHSSFTSCEANGPYDAGVTVDFDVQLAATTAPNQTMAYNLTDTRTGTVAASGPAATSDKNDDPNLFSFSVNHTVPGWYLVSVQVAGARLVGYGYELQVAPAVAHAARSTVRMTGCSESAVCKNTTVDTDEDFVVRLYDVYGNPQLGSRGFVYFSGDTASGEPSESSTEVFRNPTSNLHTFTVTYTVKGGRAISVHLCSDINMPLEQVGENMTLQVLPGAAEAPNTEIYLTSSMQNDRSEAVPGARVRCSQQLTCGGAITAGAMISLEALVFDVHMNQLEDGGNALMLQLSPIVPETHANYSGVGGIHLLAARATAANKYGATILVDGAIAMQFDLLVASGTPDAAATSIYMLDPATGEASSASCAGREVCGSVGAADTVMRMAVTVRDAFGNTIGAADVAPSVDTTEDMVRANVTVASLASWEVQPRAVDIIPAVARASSSRFNLDLNLTAAGTYALAVTLNGENITAGPVRLRVQAAPHELAMTRIYRLEKSSGLRCTDTVCGGSTQPGAQVALQVVLRDAYGNPLQQYTAADVVIDAKFQGEGTVQWLSHADGNTLLSVSCNQVGVHRLDVLIGGSQAPHSPVLLSFDHVPPSVSGSLMVDAGSVNQTDSQLEEIVVSALVEALELDPSVVVVDKIVEAPERSATRRLAQSNALPKTTTLNVSYSLVGRTMSDTEGILLASEAMLEADFAATLSNTDSMASSGYVVTGSALTSGSDSYELPQASAAHSRVVSDDCTEIWASLDAENSKNCFCVDELDCPGASDPGWLGVQAGVTLSYTISLSDTYGNQMTFNPSMSVIWRLHDAAGQQLSSLVIPGTESYAFGRMLGVSNGNGTYTVELTMAIAQSYYSVAYLGGVSSEDAVNGMARGFKVAVTWQDTTSVSNSSFTLGSDCSTAMLAGEQFTLSVATRDLFGNLRGVDDNRFNVTQEFHRPEGESMDQRGASGAASEDLPAPRFEGNGVYLLNITRTVAGIYSFTVGLHGELLAGPGGHPQGQMTVNPAALCANCSLIAHVTSESLESDTTGDAVKGSARDGGAPATAQSGDDGAPLGGLPAYLTLGFPEPMPTTVRHVVVVLAMDSYGNRRNRPNADIFILTVEPLATTPSRAGAISTTTITQVSNAVLMASGLEHRIHLELALEFSGDAVISITAPDNSQVGSQHNTTLGCPAGYLAESADGMVGGCVECQNGLVCLGGTSFEVEDGYWIADNAAQCSDGDCVLKRVYKCDVSAACTTNETADGSWQRRTMNFEGVTQLNLCKEGYDEGIILCDSCTAGYEQSPTGTCQKCKASSWQVWAQFGAVMVFIGALVRGIYILVIRSQRDSASSSDDMAYGILFLSDLQGLESDIKASAQSFKGILQILMNQLQVLGQFSSLFTTRIPGALRSVLSGITVVNFQLFDYVSLQCMYVSIASGAHSFDVGGFYADFILKASIPFILAGTNISVVFHYSRKIKNPKTSEEEKKWSRDVITGWASPLEDLFAGRGSEPPTWCSERGRASRG
ncbi:hypothetical protein CYMTET_43394 [Cymbomonas tetramitiformis]|uniref:Tyrosine-protein kinase ephrin type A/B receptor-like domain-containing protein n=1 Tax=Cymbomonas tetramitiformis TaxID=36881 RepID=A0AAE0F0B8_9CHLO|nr:hypothetical protein CYMTET_43394 [Cymbomonas tetramitiformis]